jgi:D-xylose transport system ATP-binding protein
VTSPADSSGARPADAGRASGSGRALEPEGAPAGGKWLLETRGLTKRFGAVEALSGVNLRVAPGQVTALIGDNGAGKSTLIKTVAGIWEPDLGQILWDGEPVRIRGPKGASALGIATVYQDLALCDNLDIVQNMFLGHEVTHGRLLDETAMEKEARGTLSDLSVTTVRSIRQAVGSLSGGQRQAVAVARAVMQSARLVILDEPTAALGVAQTAMVLDLIKRLRSRGIAVLVISHNLIDVFQVADRIAVLYLGRLAVEAPASEFDQQSAVYAITTGKFDGSAADQSETA